MADSGSWAHCSGCAVSRGCRSQGEEVADRRRDLGGMGLQREMAGVEEADLRVRDVALERFGAGRQEERIVLPQTARKGGLWVRKYSWKAG